MGVGGAKKNESSGADDKANIPSSSRSILTSDPNTGVHDSEMMPLPVASYDNFVGNDDEAASKNRKKSYWKLVHIYNSIQFRNLQVR